MKAMILAGGLSTRLYPLTKSVPKPLVPVAGVPNAAHLMHYLKAYGFDEIAINVHYLADAIVEALGDGSRFGVKLHYSYETELLGSAGGVKKVAGVLRRRAVCRDRLRRSYRYPVGQVTRVSSRREPRSRRSVSSNATSSISTASWSSTSARRSSASRRSRRGGRSAASLANTGVYIFSREIFEHIPRAEFYDFGKQVFPALQSAGDPFYGFHARGAYWADIGTPGEYRRASYDVAGGRRADSQDHVEWHRLRPRGSAATCASKVPCGSARRRRSPTACRSWARASSAIAYASMPRRRLERSILWKGRRSALDAKLRDTIVGTGYIVQPESVLDDALVAVEASS